MELTQLLYFRSVANTGSVTRAAEELYITQSALSRTIQRLEVEVGAKLFERDKGRFVLNENGRLFLEHVQIALSELDQGISEVSRNNERQHIRIYSFINSDILEQITDYCQALHPALTIEVESHEGSSRMDAFEAFSPDLVLTPVSEYRGYTLVREFSEEWCFIYHNGYQFSEHLLSRSQLTAKQAVNEPLIFYGSEYDKSFITNTITSTGFNGFIIQADDERAFRQAVLQAKYLGVIPRKNAVSFINRAVPPPVSLCSLSDTSFSRSIYLCRKTSFPLNEEASQIMNLISNYIGTQYR